MDWDELAEWKIEDLEWNSLVVRDTLFMAYHKTKSLNLYIAGIREVYPDTYELVLEYGTADNTINKAGPPKECKARTWSWDEFTYRILQPILHVLLYTTRAR
jgi:hypothetical protein